MLTDYWCEQIGNLIRLARSLRASGRLATAEEAIDVFERPWRYEQDWRALERSPEEDVQLVTRQQAAEYLGVSVGYLSDLAAKGTGPKVVRLGNKRAVRYRKTELARWLAEREV